MLTYVSAGIKIKKKTRLRITTVIISRGPEILANAPMTSMDTPQTPQGRGAEDGHGRTGQVARGGYGVRERGSPSQARLSQVRLGKRLTGRPRNHPTSPAPRRAAVGRWRGLWGPRGKAEPTLGPEEKGRDVRSGRAGRGPMRRSVRRGEGAGDTRRTSWELLLGRGDASRHPFLQRTAASRAGAMLCWTGDQSRGVSKAPF